MEAGEQDRLLSFLRSIGLSEQEIKQLGARSVLDLQLLEQSDVTTVQYRKIQKWLKGGAMPHLNVSDENGNAHVYNGNTQSTFLASSSLVDSRSQGSQSSASLEQERGSESSLGLFLVLSPLQDTALGNLDTAAQGKVALQASNIAQNKADFWEVLKMFPDKTFGSTQCVGFSPAAQQGSE
eukprot:6096491-Amphidinium_carterae.1